MSGVSHVLVHDMDNRIFVAAFEGIDTVAFALWNIGLQHNKGSVVVIAAVWVSQTVSRSPRLIGPWIKTERASSF